MARLKNYRMTKREQVICSVTIGVLTLAHTQWFVRKKSQEIGNYKLKYSVLESSNRDTQQLIDALSHNRKPASEGTVSSEKTVVSQYIQNSASLTNFIRKMASNNPAMEFNIRRIGALPAASVTPPVKGAPFSEKEKATAAVPFDTVPLGIELETRFLLIGKFIEQLENSKLLLDIYSIEIKRVPSNLRLCTANIKLNNYISKEKESAP